MGHLEIWELQISAVEKSKFFGKMATKKGWLPLGLCVEIIATVNAGNSIPPVKTGGIEC